MLQVPDQPDPLDQVADLLDLQDRKGLLALLDGPDLLDGLALKGSRVPQGGLVPVVIKWDQLVLQVLQGLQDGPAHRVLLDHKV